MSCFLIPAFPERLDGAGPVIDGAILMTVTHYVKTQSGPKNTSRLFRTSIVCFSTGAGIWIHHSPPSPRQISHISLVQLWVKVIDVVWSSRCGDGAGDGGRGRLDGGRGLISSALQIQKHQIYEQVTEIEEGSFPGITNRVSPAGGSRWCGGSDGPGPPGSHQEEQFLCLMCDTGFIWIHSSPKNVKLSPAAKQLK